MKVLLSLVLLAPASFAQGHVLVVDAAGGGTYTQIAAALQNAAPGDVLLVKAGSYSGFAVANQDVSIVGDVSANVQINGTVQVRNLAATKSVLLHRLRAFGATSPSANDGPGITLKNGFGPVRLQECFAQGAAGMPGVRVEGSSNVALWMTQGFGGSQWPNSGEGVLANGNAIAVYECDLEGAPGGAPTGQSPPACYGGNGGFALRCIPNGFVFVGGSYLQGGQATAAADNCTGGAYYGDWCNGGNGGTCVGLSTGLQMFWYMDNVFQAGMWGAGGTGHCGCGLVYTCDGDAGQPGLAYSMSSGDTVVAIPGPNPSLSLSANPAREGTTLGLSVESAPGDAVLLVITSAVTFAPEQNRGVRLVNWSGPHTTRRLGTTDALGHLQTSWPIADLGSGIESQIVHVQLLVVHSNGQSVWSNAISLVLLDSAF